MGMAVKGLTEHRIVREAVKGMLDKGMAPVVLTEAQRLACTILIRRADLALERIKKRKQRRTVHVAHLDAMPQRSGNQP